MEVMKNIILSVVLFFITVISVAQTAQIKDKENNHPISNVSVVNLSETRNSLSNAYGVVDLSVFASNDTLMFLHTSYQMLVVSMHDLKAQNYQVSLWRSVIQLDETVVSANRWEQKKKEVSMYINNVPRDEIQKIEPQTSADLLGATGQVFVQKSQMGGGSPMIRGFAANKILIVVDGIRMNNPIYRHGNLQNVISIDPNALENSEVLFGPGSVIYGSDAIGGVLDFHTLRHNYSEDKNVLFSGNAMLRYNSGNNEKAGHLDFNIAGKKWSSITSFTGSKYGDLNMGHHLSDKNLLSQYTCNRYVITENNNDSIVENANPYIARFSAYGQLNIMQKFAYKFNKDQNIEYAFHYSRTGDVPRYDRLIQDKKGNPKYAEWYYGPQKWMMHVLKFENKKSSALYDEMNVRLAYQDYEESRYDRKFGESKLRQRTDRVKMLTFNADFFKPLNIKHALFYGLEGTMSKVYSFGIALNILSEEENEIVPRYPDDSDYSTAALYATYRYIIRPKLTLNSGLRINVMYAYSPFKSQLYTFPFNKIESSGFAPNAMLGLVYKPNKTWQLNFNFGSAYRAPNLDDFGKVFDSEPGSVVVPNEALKSEYAYNFDVSTGKTFGDMFRVDAGVYYTILNRAMMRGDYSFNGMDSIIYDGEMSKVQAIQNIGRVDVYGAFACVYADLFKYVNLKSQINYTVGKNQDGNPYRHVPPLFGQTHVLVSVWKFKLDVSAVYNGKISPDKLSSKRFVCSKLVRFKLKVKLCI